MQYHSNGREAYQQRFQKPAKIGWRKAQVLGLNLPIYLDVKTITASAVAVSCMCASTDLDSGWPIRSQRYHCKTHAQNSHKVSQSDCEYAVLSWTYTIQMFKLESWFEFSVQKKKEARIGPRKPARRVLGARPFHTKMFCVLQRSWREKVTNSNDSNAGFPTRIQHPINARREQFWAIEKKRIFKNEKFSLFVKDTHCWWVLAFL